MLNRVRVATWMHLTFFLSFIVLPGSVSAQFALEPDNEGWCTDATTVCWAERSWLSGLRFVFEPQLGVLVQQGDNKFDDTNFRALEKIGLATSLFGRQLGLQGLFIYPSTVSFDEQSPVRINGQLVDTEDAKVDVEWGWTLGVTLMDGVMSLGYGRLNYDRRDFVDPDVIEAVDPIAFRDSFWYLNFQLIEAVKGVIKGVS